jgi:integrase
VRRRFATEKAARDELASVQGGVTTGTYVHASKLTAEQACEAWLMAKHALKPSTLRGHGVSLGPLRDELGHVEVQQLTKADLDALVGRLRRGEVAGRRRWSARSVNYLLYLCSAVLNDQVAQGNAVRNVAALVDRVAGEAGPRRTLTERDMFAILDHDCRDRHLWTLACYGLRRGEIAGLRWCNVDLNAKTVTVRENRLAVGSQIVTGTPKSKASTRTLPMPDEVVEVPRAVRKRQAEERLAFGQGYGSGEYVARPASPTTRICLPSGGAGCSTSWVSSGCGCTTHGTRARR